MPEINLNEPISGGEFVGIMGNFNKKLEHYGAIIDRIDTGLGDIGNYIAKVQAGPESEFSYHKPFLSLSGDVNVYYDPRTGRPGKATIKSWRDNVDFLGEYDLFSVFGDIGLGAAIGGYMAGSWDASDYTFTLSKEDKLIPYLASLEYGLDVDEDGKEVTASLEQKVTDLEKGLSGLNGVIVEDFTNRRYNGILDYVKLCKSDKSYEAGYKRDEPEGVERAYA